MISIVDDPPRPRIEVAPDFPELVIPAGVPQPRLLAHARRVAAFQHEHGSRQSPPGLEGDAWQVLPRFGVALSWCVDLDLLPWNWKPITAAVGPIRTRHLSAKDVLKSDVPRYDAGHPIGSRCAGKGPRGGKCSAPSARYAKRLTNPATGDWERVWGCAFHREQWAADFAGVPSPAPNRGGVLAAVFPEIDVDAIYGWADERYDPGTQARNQDQRVPVLRLVRGGAR